MFHQFFFIFQQSLQNLYIPKSSRQKKNELILQIIELKEQKETNLIQYEGKYILKYKCERQKHFDIIPVCFCTCCKCDTECVIHDTLKARNIQFSRSTTFLCFGCKSQWTVQIQPR